MVVTTTDSNGGGETQIAVETTDGANAFGVIIRYQSSDSATPQPTTTPLSGVPSSSPSQQASTTNPTVSIASPGAPTVVTATGSTSAADTPASAPSSALSTGAKIGIGAGIGGGFLLLLVIWAVYLLGRSQGRAYSSKSNTIGYAGPPLHGLRLRAAAGNPGMAELPDAGGPG
jgi:hypothetical protein